MGKSFRKHRIFGNCGGSEKKDKRICNRKVRRKAREQIERGDYELPFTIQDEALNKWSMNKDGKHYWPDATDKDMKK